MPVPPQLQLYLAHVRIQYGRHQTLRHKTWHPNIQVKVKGIGGVKSGKKCKIRVVFLPHLAGGDFTSGSGKLKGNSVFLSNKEDLKKRAGKEGWGA